jgi:hypothetical protein
MSSQEIPVLSSSDPILERLAEQLTLDDYLRLRRGLSLLDDDEPTTIRKSVPPVNRGEVSR